MPPPYRAGPLGLAEIVEEEVEFPEDEQRPPPSKMASMAGRGSINPEERLSVRRAHSGRLGGRRTQGGRVDPPARSRMVNRFVRAANEVPKLLHLGSTRKRTTARGSFTAAAERWPARARYAIISATGSRRPASRPIGRPRAVRQAGALIDAEQMIGGRQQIFRRNGPVLHVARNIVGRTDDAAAGNAAAGKQGRVGARPVIATASLDVRQFGRASVLAETDHQRVVQQPAAFQVENQSRVGEIEVRQQLVDHPRKVIEMRVPGVARQAVFVPKDGNEPGAGLDQSPRRQARLAEQRHAVQSRASPRLASHVERLGDLWRRQHGKGRLLKPRERTNRRPNAPGRRASRQIVRAASAGDPSDRATCPADAPCSTCGTCCPACSPGRALCRGRKSRRPAP